MVWISSTTPGKAKLKIEVDRNSQRPKIGVGMLLQMQVQVQILNRTVWRLIVSQIHIRLKTDV